MQATARWFITQRPYENLPVLPMLNIRKSMAAVQGVGSERLKLLGVITGGHTVIHWYQQLFPVILPTIAEALGLSNVQVGVISSSRQMANSTLNLPTGATADKFPKWRGRILALSLVVMGLAYFTLGRANLYSVVIVGALLSGLASAMWHPTALGTLSNTFPDRRATALSIHGMGATVLDTVTPLAFGALLAAFYWRTVLQLQIILGVVAALLIWRLLRNSFSGEQAKTAQGGYLKALGVLAKHPTFIGVATANGLMTMGRLIVLAFLPLYLQLELGYSPFILGVYIALLHGMGILSQPVLGPLSDKFGRKAVLAPSLIALGVLYALLDVAAPGIALALVVTAIGLFFYTLTNITTATVMDVAGRQVQASSMGLTGLVTQIFVLPAPIIAGRMSDVYGYGSAFLLAGSFLVLAGLILLPLRLYKGSASTTAA